MSQQRNQILLSPRRKNQFLDVAVNLQRKNCSRNPQRRISKMQRKMVTRDGNEAAASVAHIIKEVIVIYLIMPFSPMGAPKGQAIHSGSEPETT
jgi:hypothetical protein